MQLMNTQRDCVLGVVQSIVTGRFEPEPTMYSLRKIKHRIWNHNMR